MNLFDPGTPPLETVIRVVLVYLFLLFLVRSMGKKEIGRLSAMELLTMLILARTVGPAITTNDSSLTTAAVAACTLVGLTVFLDRIVVRSRRAERLVEGRPIPLVRDGRVLVDNLAREHVTEQQLLSALRSENVAGPEEVEAAYLEPSGKISVVPKDR